MTTRYNDPVLQLVRQATKGTVSQNYRRGLQSLPVVTGKANRAIASPTVYIAFRSSSKAVEYSLSLMEIKILSTATTIALLYRRYGFFDREKNL